MDILEYFEEQFEYNQLFDITDNMLSNDNEILLKEPEKFYHMGSEAIKAMLSEERNLKIWKLIFIQMYYNENIRTFFQNLKGKWNNQKGLKSQDACKGILQFSNISTY